MKGYVTETKELTLRLACIGLSYDDQEVGGTTHLYLRGEIDDCGIAGTRAAYLLQDLRKALGKIYM